ncbi:ABC di/oligopeptide transporter inner membrane subunit [Robertmurraya siralis]|uniref:ABC di/oligopeptide transporter inner membrane subunit n=1 Tax=Robertmurraya siralis TaxID=77777 RepID=A0A919WG88_9BACI|nr:ABC transporter permease [Robertmurraya siralis]PAE20161.1 peptide ABC transporter [Bacillus sp. 7504-2]GIN61217.1 ABC di/oligopeptide transporter inner membrane subunit [Robertmurraya siralis]
MLSYLFKRIYSLIPVLFVVSVAIFLIVHITPGDPAAIILGMEATEEQIASLNEEMGLNEPIVKQYLLWVGGVLQGDFGQSYFMKEPVLDSILSHLGPTISLAILAEIVALIIAIPIGIFAAYRRGSFTDHTLMVATLLGMAVPSFLLGLLLMLSFGVYLQWLPIAGYKPLTEGLWTHLRYLILPALSLGAIQAALVARMTRSSMLEVLNKNYVKTARSKGVKEHKVITKHALRNAFLPILTVIGQSFGTLVTGAVVVETIFNLPGLGQLIINSIERRDFAVIQGVVLFVTLIYVFINLIVDLLYGVIDPRVRLERK